MTPLYWDCTSPPRLSEQQFIARLGAVFVREVIPAQTLKRQQMWGPAENPGLDLHTNVLQPLRTHVSQASPPILRMKAS